MQAQTIVSAVERDRRRYFAWKRAIDVALASFLLMGFAPVFLVIGVLIKLDSRGPVFFIHDRVGSRRRNGWEIGAFRMIKFRSMVTHADSSLHEQYIHAYTSGGAATALESGGAIHKLVDDPRITRVGRWLRRTSLDELPQLINVVRGEMSLVGPRPVPLYEFEDYKEWHKERMAALPGMTGLWQVTGRCENSFDEQIQLDITYVRNQSAWLDTLILLKTLPAVLAGRGAG